MATKTFCDICGEDKPTRRTQLMADASSLKDFGDVCDEDRLKILDVLRDWSVEQAKSKKVMQVVAAEDVKS